MPLGLLKYGLRRKYPAQHHFPRPKELKKTYDVVIIGGGGHGLATAFYLARDYGITDIAVIEKGYLAGGNTARNTAIIRSNYLTPEGVAFYDESVRLYQDLSNDFDYNIMYSERGHFTLAHTDAAMRTSRWRAEVNKQLGVDSELIYPDEIAKLCPHLKTDHGYDNVFEYVEPGLHALDTTEDGLCLFAFVSRGRVRCSLHAAASAAGLPLESVKPKACLLWPMTFSEREEVLSLTDDALSFSCNSKRGRRPRSLSPSLREAIRIVYGEGFGTALEKEAEKLKE